MSEFGGLLRGIVVDNNDPKKLGRIKVRIQSAYGDQPVDNLPWAWPCLNYGGMPGMHNYQRTGRKPLALAMGMNTFNT